MAKIIDEKHVNNIRLLILDEKCSIYNEEIKIRGKTYKTVDVYDLPKSVAIICDEDENSFVGSEIF